MNKEYITKEEFKKYKMEFWKKGFCKWWLGYDVDETDSWNMWRQIMALSICLVSTLIVFGIVSIVVLLKLEGVW